MYELIKINENDYYIDSPSKIGIVKISENEVILIDSGNSRDVGKKIKHILDENGWTLSAIYNTHSHADHIGANNYLQKLTGCRVYAPELEADFVNHPILEPISLFGACPPEELRKRFFLAEESNCLEISPEDIHTEITPISLPGHAFNMCGFLTEDGTFYAADALASRETLDKYGIVYIYDTAAYIETLMSLSEIDAKLFVPSHVAPTEDISALAQYNLDKTRELCERIISHATGVSFETLLEKLFEDYSLTMSVDQYGLVGSTVRSYLTYLKNEGLIESYCDSGRLLYKRAAQKG